MFLFGSSDLQPPVKRPHILVILMAFFQFPVWSGCEEDTAPSAEPDSLVVDTEQTELDSSTEAPRNVPIMTGFRVAWDSLPHRISMLELTFESALDGESGVVTGRNDGGPFGAIDNTTFEYDLEIWQSASLVAQSGSTELMITPDAADFTTSQTVSIPAEAFAEVTVLVAFLRGFRISTDEYDTPPPFESDPALPYDPADGYTTQGIGIALSQPSVDGDNVVFEVQARNSLGMADREDMNAAIPQATTWMRIDYVVVGAFGANTGVTCGQTAYTISEETYGQNTVHEHSDLEQQRIGLVGSSPSSSALFGITAVDYWLNVEGHHDPECEVITEELNYLGEPVSGPGRYVRELSARLNETDYDAATAIGETHLDMFLSNSSLVTEIGNLCLALEGEVAMLQFDSSDPSPIHHQTVSLSAPSTETMTVDVTF